MHRSTTILFSAVLALFLTGCFEIEQSINLNKDMSGTADLKIGVDMEPMVVIMARMQHDMEGKKGPMTQAEIDAAKLDFKKHSTTSSSKDSSKESKDPRAEAEKSLPPGIKLLDLSVVEKEFGVESKFKFGFDSLAHLVDLRLPSKDDDPTKKNVMDTPFKGLEVTETSSTLTIRTKPQNPAEKATEEAKGQAPKMDPEMEKMMRDAFKKMRVTYRITAPFKVVSSNATRKEGNTLIWDYDFDRLEKIGTAKNLDDFGVKVTYQK